MTTFRPEWLAQYIGKYEYMLLTLDERLMVEMHPANFAAGFIEAFNRFRKNDNPPVNDPTNWFRRTEIEAWKTGYKYGKVVLNVSVVVGESKTNPSTA